VRVPPGSRLRQPKPIEGPSTVVNAGGDYTR
jgi:hypothetical protein